MLIGAVVVGMGLTMIQLLILRHHPEPDEADPDIAAKATYHSLVTTRSTLGLVALDVGLCLATSHLLGAVSWRYVAWSSTTLVLVWVDAKTTWLPLRCHQTALAATLAGLATDLWLAPTPGASLVGGLLGGLGAFGLFALIWLLTRRWGFGDVRLAGLLGLAAGSFGLDAWMAGILVGTTASALYGLVVTGWRRWHPHPLGSAFAYGPGLWLGLYCLPALWC